jgi:hypothetical protein
MYVQNVYMQIIHLNQLTNLYFILNLLVCTVDLSGCIKHLKLTGIYLLTLACLIFILYHESNLSKVYPNLDDNFLNT